jgi:hypothetical protein
MGLAQCCSGFAISCESHYFWWIYTLFIFLRAYKSKKMPRLGPIQIKYDILEAIHDDELVVFAGAGVSIGPPANLPDFEKLAKEIAIEAGLEPTETEPIDRLLGRLKHHEVHVHRKAAELLSVPTSAPTALHFDLVRLFRSPENLRLVTTNFDLHFETAVQTIFGQLPDIYRAPALPLGRDFRGLVHVHGALTHPLEMVLTDADFGRGYLTEGWARRFLVDVFRTYPVLFVGYSHNDTVMTYLARALPADGIKPRYALTDGNDNWGLLGITPILFRKGSGENAFQEIYDGVRCLSERTTRRTLDWQSRLAEIGSQAPPIDDETIGEIEQALRELRTTRFLIDVMRRPEWLKWLDTRKQLDKLFDNGPLNEREKLLAEWLATHFAIDYADELIQMIAARQMRLNPFLWQLLGLTFAPHNEMTLDDSVLSRWVSILLVSIPTHPNYCNVLTVVAARCAKQQNAKMVLEIFLSMISHSLTIKPGINWSENEAEPEVTRFEVETQPHSNHHALKKVWKNHLMPSLAVIASPLLSGICRRLEKIHHTLLAWGKAGHDWDTITWGRSAIEPHEQDRYAESIDVVIDAGRDALEYIANNHQLALLEAWMETFIISDVPLLRRLAIHAMTQHPAKSPDERLGWIMERVGLHGQTEHHEIYRAVALAYPNASKEIRHSVINAVLQYQFPNSEDPKAADKTARKHYDWLSWLYRADPTCTLVQKVLAPIETDYPIWKPRDYPDLMYWTSSGSWSLQSPWSVEQLLAKAPVEQLDDLLNFKGDHFNGPDRNSLVLVIQEACKQRPLWAFKLNAALSERSLWNSDLWSPILRGLREATLLHGDWKYILSNIIHPELFTICTYEITELLNSVIRQEKKSVALELSEQANTVALRLWQSLSRNDKEVPLTDWLTMAINHPAGRLVEFWINAQALLLEGKPREDKVLQEYYRDRLTSIIQDESPIGGMGRSVIASQIMFLFGLDEKWVREHVIPLFSSSNPKFSQAWDGFLVNGYLYDSLAEALKPAFLVALHRLDNFGQNRSRFIEFFTALIVFHTDDPIPKLLPALFESASPDDRNTFALHLGFFLRHMPAPTLQKLWEKWLHRYWRNRLDGVPRPLEQTEVKTMLEWLPYLGEFFPKAVSLIISGPSLSTLIEHSSIFHIMAESDLPTRFPSETARLLVYICPQTPPYCRQYVVSLANQISSHLDADIRDELTETMACYGFSECLLPAKPSCTNPSIKYG